QARLFEVLHALRQQAFADTEARKLFALEYQYLPALLPQQCRRQRTRGACPDHQHVNASDAFSPVLHNDQDPAVASSFSTGWLSKQGTINHTTVVPISMVNPNACNAGVLLKLSKPKESNVLKAERTTASQAMGSRRAPCSWRKIP